MPSPSAVLWLWVISLVLLIVLVNCSENAFDSAPAIYEPSWTYKCEPEKGCQRVQKSKELDKISSHYESLSVCRTVCGRFGSIWPKPVTAALGMQTVKIHPNFLRFDLIDVPVTVRQLLVKMTRVVSKNLQAECRGNVTEVSDTPVMVYITIKSGNPSLVWNTDESYTLDVQNRDGKVNVQVAAETVFGARHALETFTQLVAPDVPDYTDDYVCSLNLVVGAKIKDKPAYTHRGLLLDTSRNFIPMDSIKKTIEGMGATKMNAFHWHVTDTHSFPLESVRVPQFTRFGAYSAYEIYAAEEVRTLVDFALVHGVRVIIEIDSPAHAGNGWQWGKEHGLGDLAVCVNSKPWHADCVQPPCGQLNPANPNTYLVLKNLYRDIADMLPKPALLHVGGDEVFYSCWNSSKEIRKYMTDNKMGLSKDDFIKLWAEFHEKALVAWDEVSFTDPPSSQPVMIWSSELTQVPRIEKYLSKDRYVVEVWEPVDSSLLNQLLEHGYRTVSVPKDIWYLDHGFWGQTKYSNWRRMYSHVLPKNSTMLGGEVAMWTEYIDTMGLDGRVWPRAAAVAERLWSNPKSDVNTAEPRLQMLRERLINRGLRPDVLSPGWCAQHDMQCL